MTHEVKIRDYSLERVQRSAIDSIIGEDVEIPLVKNLPAYDFIVVSFESNEDLLALVKSMESSLYSEMYFCEQPKQKVLMGIPDVYSDGKSVAQSKLEDESIVGKDGLRDWHKYEAVLFISWEQKRVLPEYSFKEEKDRKYYLEYDLRKDPKDVCIFIGGGNIIQSIRSNTLTITAAEIRKILE